VGSLEREIDRRDKVEPGFRRLVDAELATIREFDDYVNVILDQLADRGMTREDLARAAGMQGANLRRLLSDRDANPTFATMMKVADALGLELKVVRRGDLAAAG
jgi:DNA-binding phage protein